MDAKVSSSRSNAYTIPFGGSAIKTTRGREKSRFIADVIVYLPSHDLLLVRETHCGVATVLVVPCVLFPMMATV